MDTITLEATIEQYYYRAVEKMLTSSRQILQQQFEARWIKQHGQDWEGNSNQVMKIQETLTKKKLKLTGAEREKLNGCLDNWDMTLLFKLLMNLWSEMERGYKVENDAVSQLTKMRNVWAHNPLHRISESYYNVMKSIFTASLKTLKVKEHEINEMIERAEATSIPQEGNISNYKHITELTKWDDLSNGLKSAMGNNKETCYQGKRIKLKALKEQLELSYLDGTLLVKLAKGEIPCIVNNQVPDKLQYYVHRTVKSRNKLKRELFQNISNDVILVQGIEKHELTSLVGGQETDVSGNQIDRLTVRFILLEYEPDYEKICKLTSSPVHWIRFKNNVYEWVKSSGSVKNLQKYVQDTQDCFSEEELATTTSHYKVTVISDTPGMGKTVLLANVAHQIMRQQPNMLVRFIVIKELVQGLNKKKKAIHIHLDSIVSLIAEQSSDFAYGKKLIVHSLKNAPSILMFDGFDEVLSQDIDTALMILKIVTEELSLVRVYVTTRPHMREQLENGLHVFGFTISPFDKADQINFLIKFWNFEGVSINESVHQFAKICLNALSSRITDLERDIAGIPLQCRLLAEVYTESVMRCSRVGYEAYQNSIVVTTSIFEMYEMHMNMRFQKIAASESMLQRMWTVLLGTKSQYDAIKTSHMYYALALLFPDYIHEFEQEINPTIPLQNLCALGIVEKSESKTPRFVHRTFAEYLIAWLVVEMKPTERFLSFLLNKLLGTSLSKEYMITPFGNSDPVSSHNFNFPVITYFINGFIKRLEKNHAAKDPLSTHALTNKISMMLTDSVQHKQVTRIFSAAAVNDFAHVPLAVTLSCQDFQSQPRIENPYISDLLLITAKFCGVELMKTFCSQLDLTTMQFLYSKSGSFYVTPLHVAIKRGQYTLVEHLVRSFKHQLYTLRYLLHFCVFESTNESSVTVKDKIQIIKLLMHKSKHLADEKLPDGSTPFMQKNANIELVECLIEQGADVNVCDKREETLLHKIVDSPLSPEAYHRVLLTIRKRGFEHFNKPNCKYVTPLHCALENVNVLDETLEVFKSEDACFNALDKAGDSVLFYALRYRRSVHVIRMLIDLGADWNHVNDEDMCVLHICTKHGHYDALKYLLDNYSLDVNKHDGRCNSDFFRGHTPLHGAMMKRSNSYERMQTLLIEKGADLYHRSNSSLQPQFIESFNPGKGLSVNMLHVMEDHGLIITQELASKALTQVLLNKNIMSWEIDIEFLEMLEYLIQKGGCLTLEYYDEDCFWDSEFIRMNLHAIIQATDVNTLFLNRALKYQLLTRQELIEIKRLSTNIQKSEYFYRTVEEKEESFGRICMTSLSSNQMNVFLLLRQCLQAADADTNMFITPPPRVIQFINCAQNGVMVVLTNSLFLGIKRIREAIGSEAKIVEEHDIPVAAEVSDKVIVLKCRVVTDQLVSKLLQLQSKFICVSTKINGDLENILVVADTYTWEDIRSNIVDTLRIIVDGNVCRANELFASPDIFKMLPEDSTFLEDHNNYEMISLKIGHEETSESTFLCNSIFHYILKDKLIFFGITEQELKQVAKFGQSIGHYGDELESFDYTILKDPDNFQEICNQTTLTVHLIEHNEGRFKLVRTWGFENEIKPFLESRKLCDSFPDCVSCKGEYKKLLVHFNFQTCDYNSLQNIKVIEYVTNIYDLRPRMLELLKLQNNTELLQLKKLPKSLNLEFNQIESITKIEQIEILVKVIVVKLKTDESEWNKLQCVAVNTVLPNFVKIVEASGLQKYKQAGVLRYKDNSLVFTHDALSAYIIAELVMVNERIVVSELLDLNVLRNQIFETIFESRKLIMPTRRHNIDFVETFSYDKSKIYIFKSSWIHHFIESFIREESFDNPLTNHLIPSTRSESKLAYKWIFACVYSNRFKLLELLFSIGVHSYFTKWELLLVLAIKCADIPIFDLVVTQYVRQSGNDIRDLEFKLDLVDSYFGQNITILHVAVLCGNYLVLEHLLNNYGFNETLNQPIMCDVIHFCVVDTTNSSNFLEEHVNVRKNMIQLLLQSHPLLVNQRDKVNRTALLVPKIHVELILHLIYLGVDLYATDETNHYGNFLHGVPEYLNPHEFDTVVKTLKDLGHSELFHSQRQKGKGTPLYCAVEHLEVLDSTLDLFSSAEADFNAVDEDGDTVLHKAVTNCRSMRLLDALVCRGADIHARGRYERNFLHTAVNWGNITALTYFIMKGVDVNATDVDNDTPLHVGIESVFNESVYEVVQLLVRNGASVNSVGAQLQTPLLLALERSNEVGQELSRTIQFLKDSGGI